MTSAVEERIGSNGPMGGASGSVNDLAIRVGTVNGSGSQTANLVLVRSLFGMGIPCAAKNVFPSNIEGLPTWFHIRASGAGYLSNHLRPQVLVCMNGQTAATDLEHLVAGGICFYRDEFDKDEGFVAVREKRGAEVRCFSVPFGSLAEQAYPPEKGDKGYRDKLRKVVNMVYVGVVAHALEIEVEAVHSAIRQMFPGRKAKAAAVNVRAADAGFAWAQENLPGDLPYKVRRMDETGDKILIEGNQAAALGAVFGGASVMTWYPITPSSSLAEYAEGYLSDYRREAGWEADVCGGAGRG